MELDTIGEFMRRMGRIPLLSHEEEIKLCRDYGAYRKIEVHLIEEARRNVNVREYLILTQEKAKTACLARKIVMTEQDEEILSYSRNLCAQISGHTIEEIVQIERKGMLAKNLLISANIRLVITIAKKYTNRGMEFLDLIQEGSIGLNRAIELFNPAKGYRFSTYAYPWIRQAMTRAISDKGKAIRIPAHNTDTLNKIRKAQKEMILAEEKISIAAIANKIGKTEEQIRFVIQSNYKIESLDRKVGADQDLSILELIPSLLETPDQSLEQSNMQELIPSLLSILEEKEKMIISLRYGLNGSQQTFSEIGQILNLSHERIRQIERNAMKKMRTAAPQFEEFRLLLV
jgi:RNA polymerase nonessential primary-like sigma factor